MRARILGSNPLDILVRCSCSRKFSVLKVFWYRVEFLRCDKCGSLISYNSLTVIRLRGGESLSELNVTQEELLALREMETQMREFVEYYDRGVRDWRARGGGLHHPFADRTQELVVTTRSVLMRIDGQRETPGRAPSNKARRLRT
jgi:hypothetical protein